MEITIDRLEIEDGVMIGKIALSGLDSHCLHGRKIVNEFFFDVVARVQREYGDALEASFLRIILYREFLLEPVDEQPAVLIERNYQVTADAGGGIRRVEGVFQNEPVILPDHPFRIENVEDRCENQLSHVGAFMFNEQRDTSPHTILVNVHIRETGAGHPLN